MFNNRYMKMIPVLVCISLYAGPACALSIPSIPGEVKSWGKGMVLPTIGACVGGYIGWQFVNNPLIGIPIGAGAGVVVGAAIDHRYAWGREDKHQFARKLGNATPFLFVVIGSGVGYKVQSDLLGVKRGIANIGIDLYGNDSMQETTIDKSNNPLSNGKTVATCLTSKMFETPPPSSITDNSELGADYTSQYHSLQNAVKNANSRFVKVINPTEEGIGRMVNDFFNIDYNKGESTMNITIGSLQFGGGIKTVPIKNAMLIKQIQAAYNALSSTSALAWSVNGSSCTIEGSDTPIQTPLDELLVFKDMQNDCSAISQTIKSTDSITQQNIEAVAKNIGHISLPIHSNTVKYFYLKQNPNKPFVLPYTSYLTTRLEDAMAKFSSNTHE